jgi:hypothetical protein
MIRKHLLAVALVGGLLMVPAAHAPALAAVAQPAAAALPLANADVAKGSGVTLVKRGRGGGGRRGIRSGGGRKSFGRGGGGRKFGRGGGQRKFGGGRRKFRGGSHRRRYGKRSRGRSLYYYAPYVPYYYYNDYGYYDGDCDWLRRKARRTGSSYWWRRYDRCIND